MRKLVALPLMVIGSILAIALLVTVLSMALTLLFGLVATLIVVGVLLFITTLLGNLGEWADV
jgi:hypothetical protein